MLILSRKQNEQIVIDGKIVVTVVEIRAGNPARVRLGIEAPREMPVHRSEIQERILAESGPAIGTDQQIAKP